VKNVALKSRFSKVRRERMAHIELASPSHTFGFLNLCLHVLVCFWIMTLRDIERILYFEAFVCD